MEKKYILAMKEGYNNHREYSKNEMSIYLESLLDLAVIDCDVTADAFARITAYRNSIIKLYDSENRLTSL